MTTLEDSMEDIRFTINIPLTERLEVNGNINSGNYLENIISQQILDYLAAKLNGVGGRVSKVFNQNIPQAYQNSIELGVDVFVSSHIKVNQENSYSMALIQFFPDISDRSVVMASSLVYRLKKMVNTNLVTPGKLFAKVAQKEEDAKVKREDSIPSIILALCLGSDVVDLYQSDPDTFISQIVENFLYSIVDCFYSESFEEVNLADFAD